MTLGTANTFSGDTVVGGGTLVLNNADALAGSNLNYNNQGGALSFGSLTAANIGGLSGAQALALTNGSSAAVTLTIGANNQNPTCSGALSGAGSLAKSGSGTSTLTTDASHTGTTMVNAGVLSVTNLTGTSGISVGGGTFNAQSYNNSATMSISPGAAANISGTDLSLAGITNDGTISFTGATGTITLASLSGAVTTTFSAGGVVATLTDGTVNFNGSIATVSTLGDATVNLLGNLTVDGGTQTTGSITGNGGLIKNTATTLTLNGTNTYTGTSVLNDGIFSTNYVPAGQITFNDGTWQFTGPSGTKALNASGTSSYKIDVTNALTITRPANTYVSTIKTGGGTLTLANNNADAGNLRVDEGTAILAGAGNQGIAVVNVANVTDVKPGATLKLGKLNGVNFVDGNIYRAFSFHMSGGTFDVNGDTANTVPAIDGSGFITNSASGTTSIGRMYMAGSSKTFSGNMVDGNGKLGLNLAGSNSLSWTLSGNNTYSGATTVANGTLKAGSATAFSANSTFTVNGGTTLDLAGFNNQLVGLNGGGTVKSTAAGTAILIINNDTSNSAADTTFSGPVQDGGTGMIVALTKYGSRKQTLSGLNTYSGSTTVLAGTLSLAQVNASNETSTVTIDPAATLDLTFAGTDTVDKLYIGPTQMGAGVYKSLTNLGAGTPISQITGTGTLTVTTGPPGGYSTWIGSYGYTGPRLWQMPILTMTASTMLLSMCWDRSRTQDPAA